MRTLVGILFLFLPFQLGFGQWITLIETMERVESFYTAGDYVYATAYMGMVLRSSDNGATWINTGSGLPEFDVPSITWCKGYMFATSPSVGVYRLQDGGDSWEKINNGLSNIHATILASNDSLVFVCTHFGGVYVTNDMLNWSIANEGLNNLAVNSLLYHDDILYAGCYKGDIFISKNYGKSWQQIADSISILEVTALAVKDNYIFAGTSGDGIFASSDNGVNWYSVNQNRDMETHIWKIEVHDNKLFTATSRGVFTSSDNGESWIEINEGLPGGTFGDIIYSMIISGDYIYAGNGWSILRRPLSEVTGVDDEQQGINNFILEQNYPNPFNPETTIKYFLDKAEHVSLYIYNITGEVVRTLIPGEMQGAGAKEIQWDAVDNNGNSVSSGVYFYRIKAGEYVETKKMIVLR